MNTIGLGLIYAAIFALVLMRFEASSDLICAAPSVIACPR